MTRIPAIRTALVVSLVAVVTVGAPGCQSLPDPARTAAEDVAMQNLETSLELVRRSLLDASNDRDRFQDLYISANADLGQHRDDSAYLEARLRAELQSRLDAEQRVLAADRKLAVAESARGQMRTLVDTFEAGKGRDRTRLDEANRAREALAGRLSEQRVALEQSRASVAALTEERNRFRSMQEDATRQLQSGTATAGIADADRSKALIELTLEVETLRPLRAEVEKLRAQSGQMEMALRQENQIRVDAERSAQDVGQHAPAESLTLAAFARDYSAKSLSALRAGQFDRASLTFAGTVGGAALFLVLALVTWIRMRRWRSRALAVGLEFAAHGLRSGELSGESMPPDDSPKRFSVPAELVEGPAAGPDTVDTGVGSGGDGQLDAAVQEVQAEAEWNSAVTEDLSDMVREDPKRQPRSGPTSSSAGKTSDEDQLLQDLRKVIENKFNP